MAGAVIGEMQKRLDCPCGPGSLLRWQVDLRLGTLCMHYPKAKLVEGVDSSFYRAYLLNGTSTLFLSKQNLQHLCDLVPFIQIVINSELPQEYFYWVLGSLPERLVVASKRGN